MKMKIFYFYLLLLFMVFECKCDNNSTKISPTSVKAITVAATTATNLSIISTTALPTTTSTKTPSTTSIIRSTTTLPTTTTSMPSTTTTTIATTTTTSFDDSKNFDYQVCGNVTKNTDCTCINGTLNCEPLRKYYCGWSCRIAYPPFRSTNIKILNESFVVKSVNFWNNEFITLKKGKVVPGHEHTVEILKLRTNKIYKIENGTFDKFTAVKHLDISYNWLKNFTTEVLTPQLGSTLETLDISENAFDIILDLDFSNLGKLKYLNLYNNPRLGRKDSFLKYVFPEALENLTKINLSWCGITVIGDDTFMNLESLETLLLYHNPLTTFPKSIFSLENLKYLDLDGTSITVLNYTETNATMKLEKLLMCNSLLNMIDDCAFCNFPKLKELHLYNNPYLSYIHENAFGYAYNETSPPLKSFSLEQCNLSMIPEELLNWHNISQYGLGNNPFMCNCSMAWLINDILSPTHSVNLKDIAPQPYRYSWDRANVDFQCSGPYALKNIPFTQLSRNFCPNEIKKECKIKEKIVTVTELPPPYFISWFHVIVMVTVALICFTFGACFMPFFRYICRRRPKIQPENGFFNQNFQDDLIHEDFDDEKV